MTIFEDVAELFPRLARYLPGIAFKQSPPNPPFGLEFYAKGEEDSFDPSRPAVERFGTTATALDVAGDIVSHYLGRGVDSTLTGYYDRFVASLTAGEETLLHEQYQYAVEHEGETRPFATTRALSLIPAYFRGYAFRQWENARSYYTTAQLSQFDQMMEWMRSTPPPEAPPPQQPAPSQDDNVPLSFFREPSAPRPKSATVATLVRYQYHYYLLHKGQETILLDPYVTDWSWDDSNPVTTGSLSLAIPDEAEFDIADGDRVRCVVSADGQSPLFLWEMRLAEPESTLSTRSGSVQLRKDLGLLQNSTDSFKFVKGKGHPNGWTASEIAREILGTYQLPIDVVQETTYRIARLVGPSDGSGGVSPFDMIVKAYEKERAKTGKRFVISYGLRGVRIEPLSQSERMLAIGPTLIEASLKVARTERFATAVTVRGTAAKSTTKDRKGHRTGGNVKTGATVTKGTPVGDAIGAEAAR